MSAYEIEGLTDRHR